MAETNRPPFDLVEADSELVGGFVTEYSSIRFALFFLAEFMNTITMSAITVTLFFGGPDGPIPHIPHLYWLWPILWFLGKTIVFLFVFVWLRAALPRLRYDQLMDLGWKRLIPLSLGWLLIVAGFVIDGWWGVGMAARRGGRRGDHHPGLRHRRRAGGDPGHRAPGRRPPVEPTARARRRPATGAPSTPRRR